MAEIEDLLAKLDGVVPRGQGQWVALCPAHDDKTQSLSIGVGDGGRPLVYCHAGCEWEAISRSLSSDRKTPARRQAFGKPVSVYDYLDERGQLLFQVVRDEEKRFRQRR